MVRKQKIQETNNFVKLLAEHLKQEPIISEDTIRFSRCPMCGASPTNPAFVVTPEKGLYYGHCCGKGGTVRQLLGADIPNEVLNFRKENNNSQKNEITPENLYQEKSREAEKLSIIDTYLSKRGIKYSTWSDLDYSLKVYNPSSNNPALIYPFINNESKIVAVQKTFIDRTTKQRGDRRYSGSKGQGVALLKKANHIIVAEGLETGLSVRQYLGNDYGLIVCGDAGNLSKLARTHLWTIKECKQVIIAADNDLNQIGIKAAREVFFERPFSVVIKTPERTGWDWNDVLMKGSMNKEWI